MVQKTKTCPYCCEEIHVRAIKCKHCRTMLNGSESAHPEPQPQVTADTRISVLRKQADEASSNPVRIPLLLELAGLLENEKNDLDAALKVYQEILSLVPTHRDALKQIQLIHIHRDDTPELTKALELELELITDIREKNELRLRLAFLFTEKLGRFSDAIGYLHAVLSVTPNEGRARKILDDILERWTSPSIQAVELQLGLLALDKRWMEQIILLRAQASREVSQRKMFPWLERLLEIQMGHLQDDEGTFETLREMVRIRPEEHERWDRLLRLGRSLGRQQEVAGLAKKLLVLAIANEPTAAEKLKDIYHRILEVDGRWSDLLAIHHDALVSLKGRERLPVLEEILALREDHLQDDLASHGILEEIIRLDPSRADARRRFLDLGRSLDKADQSIGVLTEIGCSPGVAGTPVEQEIRDQTLDALVRWEDWGRFIALCRSELEQVATLSDRLTWLERIHNIQAERQRDSEAAFSTLIEIIETAPVDRERLGQLVDEARHLDRLDQVPPLLTDLLKLSRNARGTAATLIRNSLETVLSGLEDWTALLGLYRDQLSETEEPPERIRLFKKIVALQAGQLKDAAGTFGTMQEMVSLAPVDRKRIGQFMDLGERLGRLDEIATFLRSLAERGEIAGTRVQSDLHTHVLEALRRAESWDLLAEEHRRRRDAAGSDEERGQELDALYQVQRYHLDDTAAAIETLQARLEIPPIVRGRIEELLELAGSIGREGQALRFLDELSRRSDVVDASLAEDLQTRILANLEENERWDEVLVTCRRRLQEVGTPAEKVRWLDRILAVLVDHLEDQEGAFQTLLDSLSFAPASLERLRQFVDLGEALGRSDVVIEVLSSLGAQHALGKGDQEKIERIRVDLLSRTGRWKEVLEAYRIRIDASDTLQTRLQWMEKILDVQSDHLKDGASASQTLKQMVTLDPTDQDLRRRFIADGERRGTVEETIQALQEFSIATGVAGTPAGREIQDDLFDLRVRTGRWDELLRVHRERLKVAASPLERLKLLEHIFEIQAGKLEDEDGALQTLLAMLRINPGSSELRSTVSSWTTRLEETGALLDLLADLIGDGHRYDAGATRGLRDLLFETLTEGEDISGPILSCVEWEAANGPQPTSRKAREHLRAVYPRMGRWKSYLTLLRDIAKETGSRAQRRAILQEAALLVGTKVDDLVDRGILLREIFRQFPEDPSVAQAYEKALTEAGDCEHLEELYRVRIARTPVGKERADLRIRRALLLVESGEHAEEVIRELTLAAGERPDQVATWRHLGHQLHATVVPADLLLSLLGVVNHHLTDDTPEDLAEEIVRVRQVLLSRMAPEPLPPPVLPDPPPLPPLLPKRSQSRAQETEPVVQVTQPIFAPRPPENDEAEPPEVEAEGDPIEPVEDGGTATTETSGEPDDLIADGSPEADAVGEETDEADVVTGPMEGESMPEALPPEAPFPTPVPAPEKRLIDSWKGRIGLGLLSLALVLVMGWALGWFRSESPAIQSAPVLDEDVSEESPSSSAPSGAEDTTNASAIAAPGEQTDVVEDRGSTAELPETLGDTILERTLDTSSEIDTSDAETSLAGDAVSKEETVVEYQDIQSEAEDAGGVSDTTTDLLDVLFMPERLDSIPDMGVEDQDASFLTRPGALLDSVGGSTGSGGSQDPPPGGRTPAPPGGTEEDKDLIACSHSKKAKNELKRLMGLSCEEVFQDPKWPLVRENCRKHGDLMILLDLCPVPKGPLQRDKESGNADKLCADELKLADTRVVNCWCPLIRGQIENMESAGDEFLGRCAGKLKVKHEDCLQKCDAQSVEHGKESETTKDQPEPSIFGIVPDSEKSGTDPEEKEIDLGEIPSVVVEPVKEDRAGDDSGDEFGLGGLK
ncbi:MAG: hypothetical protein ABIK09_10065 [Pseudomonadota bacterium]